jgi:hypothetical protein
VAGCCERFHNMQGLGCDEGHAVGSLAVKAANTVPGSNAM